MARRSMAKRTDAEERRATVAAFRASGLGQAEFAEKRGLKVGTLRCWLYASRRESGGNASVARFIDVTASVPVRPQGGEAALVLRVGGAVVELRELPPPEWLVAVSRGATAR